MANRTTSHGLTADINRKMAARYDVEDERKVRQYIKAVTGKELGGELGMDNFHEILKDGTVLCELVNALQPGSVKKINTSKMVFKQQENISMFLDAAGKIGVPSHSSFQTVDLYENRNMLQVLSCITFLSSAAEKKKLTTVPAIGAKIADKNERTFSAETLAEGQKHASLFTGGTNKGASQAGMTSFGTSRKL